MLVAQVLHWSVALVPVLVLLALFISFDVFKLMSLKEVLVLLLLGGIAALASWPVSGRLLDTLPLGFSLYSRFVAPWVEEFIKGLVIVMLFRMNRIGFKLDAVLAGFAVGAGFSVIENIIYLIRMPDYGTGTWLVRGLGTAVMHGTTLAILAATAHELAERETRQQASRFDFNLWWFAPGYVAASAIHMLFNQFPDRPLLAMLGAILLAPIAVLVIFHFGTAEAERWLNGEYRQHREQLAVLRSGEWPQSRAGTRIAALASRCDPQTGERIRRYWQVQAYLVTEAEETLIEESGGDAVFDRSDVIAALDELSVLRKSIGPTTLNELERLLPFSRNDYWEVNELRQRVGR